MMEALSRTLTTLGNNTRDCVRHATSPAAVATAAEMMSVGAVKIE